MKIRTSLILIIFVLGFFSPLSGASAISFNNGYIISDNDLTDYNAMTLDEIQQFLDRKSGGLGAYSSLNKNGVMKKASEIIYQAASDYKISPKFLLVMLQKEQSLVENGSNQQKKYDWAMGYGVCDSCDLNDPALLVFKGFGTQVDRAAWRNRWYIDSANNGWLKAPGKTYTIDGHEVLIANQATANLYNYTPHIQGNYNFWKIWNRWFSQNYPDGSLLQAQGEKGVWLIRDGMRRPFFSKGALISRFDINKVIVVGKNELDKYEIGAPIKFANYSLLKTPLGNVYLLINDKLRKFESKEVLRVLGFNPEEFEDLSLEDFGKYELGEPITLQSSYPSGALLQNKKTGGVFFVQDGQKYPIIAKDIMKINFPRYRITPVSIDELDKYPQGESVKIKDGEIVRTMKSPSVYIISNGEKRPIASGDIFERLGYKWKNVKTVDEKSLSNMPLGSYIDLQFKK